MRIAEQTAKNPTLAAATLVVQSAIAGKRANSGSSTGITPSNWQGGEYALEDLTNAMIAAGYEVKTFGRTYSTRAGYMFTSTFAAPNGETVCVSSNYGCGVNVVVTLLSA